MDVDGESGGGANANAAPESGARPDSGQPQPTGTASAGTGEEKRCTLCKAKFLTPLMASTHYSGKWHKINEERAASGLPALSKQDAVSKMKQANARERIAASISLLRGGGVGVPPHRHPFSAPPSFHPHLPPGPPGMQPMGMGMRMGMGGNAMGMGFGNGMQRSPVPFRPPMPMAPMSMSPRMPQRMQKPVRPAAAQKPPIDLYAYRPVLTTINPDIAMFKANVNF